MTAASSPLLSFLGRHGPRQPNSRPWPRFQLDQEGWIKLGGALASNSGWALLGLWAEAGPPAARVHVALLDEDNSALGIASLECPEGKFPSLAWTRPGAIRLERTVHDLWGLVAEGAEDDRPWLDHGTWPRPPGPGRTLAEAAAPYVFSPVEGWNLHQIPVGPVHAGIIEPGHFRFTCSGEAVVRLEERLGYVHKGIEHLLNGASLERAAKLVARVSGDSTVAYSLAFARAVEAATGSEVSPRAHHLRALMAEMERVANHLGDIGAICNDAAFAFMLAECGALREQVARTALACFGHRFMMDRIVPGGVAQDLTEDNAIKLVALVAMLRKRFPRLVKVYDNKASLQDRTMGTGTLSAALAHRFAAGGFIGRASSRSFDARLSLPYPPYDELEFTVPEYPDGDVNARVWVRIKEVEVSLGLIARLIASLPPGPACLPLTANGGEEVEGMALVEGFRGDILVWLRLAADGTVVRCHPRDPSWFQWPLLEAVIDGNIVPDFPLCNKSFNCSYAGHDL
ncbi:Hydrogenase expression protein HypE [uncultured Gammaproteobacteria bacterium]